MPIPTFNFARAPFIAIWEIARACALACVQLGGKCGQCEFLDICGGSRARAFTTTGAPMASDPLCAYEPGQTSRQRAAS